VDILRKLGIKVFYGDASRLDLLIAAGAENAKVLIVALDDPDKVRELVATARKNFPHLKILARATSRTDAYELLDDGLEHVYRETLDTSLRMGVDALSLLGRRSFEAHRSSLMFRRHDEGALRELVAVRHDQRAYLSQARQRIHDLEEVMQQEQSRGDAVRDTGWDTESLREDIRQTIAADSE
jgi:voltage-gated potassium channel Kch